MKSNQQFYHDLIKHEIPLERLLNDERLFKAMDVNWDVIVVDTKNSTQAVKNGMHHAVNLAATGSIIAVLNELKEIAPSLRIPYFFGGDGATFLIPNDLSERILTILENYRHYIKQQLFLTLKVGSLSVKEVYDEGYKIKIAQLTINEVLTIPVALGNGLKYAEAQIKSSFIDETEDLDKTFLVNLDGLECRWDEVAPPEEEERILCLIVNCENDANQAQIYHDIVVKINQLFGNHDKRHPISATRLNLDLAIDRIRKEMYAKIGKYSLQYLMKNWILTVIGKYYFRFINDGKRYVKEVSQLSYSVMVDGSLNMVISGKQEEIDQLVPFLDDMEKQGKMIYGIHNTYGSILSCYVEDRKKKHIHFVDGTEGGYTTAAKMYKAKLAS